MSYKKTERTFFTEQADLLEKKIGEKVAGILQQEYAGIPSPVKQISARRMYHQQRSKAGM